MFCIIFLSSLLDGEILEGRNKSFTVSDLWCIFHCIINICFIESKYTDMTHTQCLYPYQFPKQMVVAVGIQEHGKREHFDVQHCHAQSPSTRGRAKEGAQKQELLLNSANSASIHSTQTNSLTSQSILSLL